ncbi:MAG: biotin/lipoyl-binding protein [Rubrivivax sp.]|nr:biotin/lipoyl-binding protein [Rubrivivax sp.]
MSGVARWQAAPALTSANWFRVGGLRPMLAAQVRVQRQVVRGEVWQTLVRADGARSFRMNAAAWALVGRCDGQLRLQRLWDIALAETADAAPTQDEVMDWMARLHAAGFLTFDRAPEFERLPSVAAVREDDATRQPQNWMAWRLALGAPDAALTRGAQALRPLLQLLSRPWLLGLALLIFGVMAMVHGAGLLSAAATLAASPQGLWLALLLYPPVKLLHELAHGLVSRHLGAPVPQWGVSFLLFVPLPYVDASAASALPRARQRLAVAAAGIGMELALAALGLAGALALQPGLWRDAALTLFFIGTVSTVLVNGNPLLRFDGYHMLCDAVALPNLATRSHRWWMQQLRRRVLGEEPAQPLLPAAGEGPWLWAYAPLALLMRWVVSIAVLWWMAGISVWLGLAVAVALGWALIGRPLKHALQAWRGGQLPLPAQARARRRLLGAAVLTAILLAAPWPHRTLAQGVWWLPESALVRTQVDGFVAEVLVEHGEPVSRGDVLLRLHSPALEAEQSRLQARLAALEDEHWQAVRDDAARAVQLQHDLQAARAELERTQALLAQCELRAEGEGRLALAAQDDLPGRWLARGSLVAHVVGDEGARIQVAVPHEQAALMAGSAAQVQILRATPGQADIQGQWNRQFSGAGARLPSAALAERSGGQTPTDPQDREGRSPLRPMVVAEIAVPAGPAGADDDAARTDRIGERVWVRFDHGWSPLAWQAARALQQLVLRHVNPST